MNKTRVLLLVLIILASATTLIAKPASSAETKENTWSKKAPMTMARANPGVAVVNGKIYVIGGSPLNTINEMYDPASDTWTTLARCLLEEKTLE